LATLRLGDASGFPPIAPQFRRSLRDSADARRIAAA